MIYQDVNTGQLYRAWILSGPRVKSACLAEYEPHKLVWIEQLSTYEEAQKRLQEKTEMELGLEFISSSDNLSEWERAHILIR